jgi:cellulose 1,4-beta-cellobiosidase
LLCRVGKDTHEGQQMKTLMDVSTAVWLDRIAALTGGSKNGGRMSLSSHLQAAKIQARNLKGPIVLPLVIYNLPNRDCAALASNGELQGAAVSFLPSWL